MEKKARREQSKKTAVYKPKRKASPKTNSSVP
jgi:hypothetical protein